MDKKSKYGYKSQSPYRNSPYLDIHTPQGTITMEDVPHDIIGITPEGEVQYMKANSGDYRFNSSKVREYPVKQVGGSIPNMGNPYDLLDPTETTEYALEHAKRLKLGNNGQFKALLPMNVWNDDLMNYIEKFKFVKRHGERFVKVRGKMTPPASFQPEYPMEQPMHEGGLIANATIHGKKLTKKQRKLFTAICQGKKMDRGGSVKALYKYLFEDDEDIEASMQPIKETEQISQQEELPPADVHELGDPDTELAMQILMDAEQDSYLIENHMDIANSSEGIPGFRAFGSYAEGKAALHNQLELYKTGRTKNPVRPNSTLLEAMSVYAPAADNNNPQHYAGFIAKKLGISVNTPIKNIDTKKWADAIEKMEGNKKGNNPGNLRR